VNFTLRAGTLPRTAARIPFYRAWWKKKKKPKSVRLRTVPEPGIIRPTAGESATRGTPQDRNNGDVHEAADSRHLGKHWTHGYGVVLKQLLVRYAEDVFATQGTLDKYIGDAAAGVSGVRRWKSKDHSAKACNAPVTMMTTVRGGRNQGRPKESKKWISASA